MRGWNATLRRWAFVGGLLGAATLIGGSVWYRISGSWPAGGDLILITVDTLRPDRIGAYGYTGARTPIVDTLAASGTRFTSATTPFPRTTPAIASLFTGLWPHHHGSREVGEPMRRGETIASILKRRGYATIAVTASAGTARSHNLDAGFDTYRSLEGARAEWVTRTTLQLVESIPQDQPLFLWAHYSDPHFPYQPPPKFERSRGDYGRVWLEIRKHQLALSGIFANRGGHAAALLDDFSALYDGEIAYTDHQIGQLLAGIRGRTRRAITVFTSDHGENLGEAGLFYEHGPNVHDASLRVPLIVSGPGVPRGRVDDGAFRLEDLMPSLLIMLGVPASERPIVDGMDLSQRLERWSIGSTPAPVAVAESGSALHVQMFNYLVVGRADDLHCINDERYSLCATGDEPPQLFDHVADPGFTRDLSAERPAQHQRLLEANERWPAEAARERTARTPRFKLVEYPQLEGGYRRALYDLHADPGETHDVRAEHPEVLRKLAAALESWAADLDPFAPQPRRPEDVEALRALGYIE